MNTVSTVRPLIIAMLVTFLLSLAAYVLTLPLSITLEDAGLFQMICHNGGIGHPPGYPLFFLVCQGFVNLPFFSQDVFAGNFLSAIFASASCATLVVILRQFDFPLVLSSALSLAYGFSATFWSQAIIIEVYSLAVLLFLVCLSLSLAYAKTAQAKYLLWLALSYGLALSNHWPLQVLASLALVAILSHRIVDIFQFIRTPKHFLIATSLFLFGLAPYLSLFQAAPEFSVYGGLETGTEFLKYVTRAAYSDQGELAGFQDKVLFQQWLVEQFFTEMTIPLGILAVLGLFLSFKRMQLNISVALVLLYLGATSLINLMLGFEFNELRVAIFYPYPVISYVALVVWLGIAVQWIAEKIGSKVVWLRACIPVFLVFCAFAGNFPGFHNRDNNFSQAYGEAVLNSLPADAVLFAEGDVGVGVIGYLHHVENQRQDIELRSWNNLVFNNRLTSPYQPIEEQGLTRDAYIEQSQKRVFSTIAYDEQGLRTGVAFEHNVAPGFICDQSLHAFVEQLVVLDQMNILSNAHEKYLLAGLLLEFTRLHVETVSGGNVAGHENSEHHQSEVALLSLLESTFPGKRVLAVASLRNPKAIPKDKFELFVGSMQEQMPPRAGVRVRALMKEYVGRAALLEPADFDKAVEAFEESVSLFPRASNTSVCPLYQTYLMMQRPSKASELAEKFPDSFCMSTQSPIKG